MEKAEFNRKCMEYMGYEYDVGVVQHGNDRHEVIYESEDIEYNPHDDLNQLAEVFDKAWDAVEEQEVTDTDGTMCLPVDEDKGIKQAMTDFIANTLGVE